MIYCSVGTVPSDMYMDAIAEAKAKGEDFFEWG